MTAEVVPDDLPETEFVSVTPQDIWPGYETGGTQYPPEDDQESFDRARVYEAWHAGVPQPLRTAFQMPPEALEWATGGQDTDLLFWGYVGTGKSYSSVAAGTLRAAYHHGSFRFEGAGKALRTLKDYSNREVMEIMRADLTRPDVLVLDDIGREKFNDPDVASLTELLDERQGAGKVTIFTTNLAPILFEEYFGNHLTSRLLGGTLSVRIVGRDRRQNP